MVLWFGPKAMKADRAIIDWLNAEERWLMKISASIEISIEQWAREMFFQWLCSNYNTKYGVNVCPRL